MKKTVIIAALICAVLCGCVSGKTPYTNSGEEKIESYLEALCSEEFAGRLPGTAGNDLTIEWLSQRLDAWDIEPYGGESYLNGYLGRVNTYERFEFILTDADGVSRNLVQGKDFFIMYREGNFNITLEKGSDRYAAAKSAEEYGEISNNSGSGLEIVFNIRRAFIGTGSSYFPNMTENPVITVDVSDEIGAIIENGDFEKLEIINEIKAEARELY
ncbi:MAG: hypothetical protein LBS19_11150 [Clostridiales bacterium]|jgi:hypothetical protein|nr:hypothetical protein [Clostridiales bacterium]